MADINLLPIDLSPSRGSFKFAYGIRTFLVYCTGIFLFISMLGVVYIFFLTNQVNSSVVRQQSLKQKIQSLEATEQKFFLIKDRVQKIKLAQTGDDAGKVLSIVGKSFSSLPASVHVDSIDIGISGSRFSVTSTDSLGMSSFLNSVVVSGIYKSLKLTGFTFSTGSGYKISFEGSV